MFTHDFDHHFVYTYANLGTASTRLNLYKQADRIRLQELVKDAHVWIDSYRSLAISKFGFSDDDIRKLNPSMIVARVRCYGTRRPWALNPGFHSQGSASSVMMGHCGEGVGDGRPQWPPGIVMNDYTTGYMAALAIQSTLLKGFTGATNPIDGWLLSPSLCGTAMGILKYFQTERFEPTPQTDDEISKALPPETVEGQTSLGYLKILGPLPKLSLTPLGYEHYLLETMGSSKPCFPGYDDGYDVKAVMPMPKEEIVRGVGLPAVMKMEQLRAMGKQARTQRDAVGATRL